jgi:hypothetical protein
VSLISVISAQVLDLAALANRYSDVADIYLQGPYLTVQNEDWLWFCFDASGTAPGVDDYPAQHSTRIRALIGRPVRAIMKCRNSRSLNLALSRLPTGGIFIDNEYEVVFTVREIQRRLQSGEDWEYVGQEFM